jgi:hypothetical protein
VTSLDVKTQRNQGQRTYYLKRTSVYDIVPLYQAGLKGIQMAHYKCCCCMFCWLADRKLERLEQSLDELVEGRCRISAIPTISVVWRNEKWVTADNRRLWVFRHLEKLGKCTTIRGLKYISDVLTPFSEII